MKRSRQLRIALLFVGMGASAYAHHTGFAQVHPHLEELAITRHDGGQMLVNVDLFGGTTDWIIPATLFVKRCIDDLPPGQGGGGRGPVLPGLCGRKPVSNEESIWWKVEDANQAVLVPTWQRGAVGELLVFSGTQLMADFTSVS